MKKAILALTLAIAVACPAWASVENDNHVMAGGTFGVAWLDATGELRVYDGQKTTRFMEFYQKGMQIAAVDIDGADGAQPQCVLTWKTVLTPAGDKPVLLNGRNAYFGLGLRFIADLDTGARFFNSTGVHDGKIVRDDERVKPCQWFGITGKVQDKPITLIIYDQPGNTRPMTGYTMGDAGKTSTYMSATMATREKPIELKPGESLTACYKIVVTDEEHE